jgi:hypothetical protein
MRVKKNKNKEVSFTARVQKFGRKGEKSGWTYIEVPAGVAHVLLPGNRKSFRVRGMLDMHPVKGLALLPMGDGNFILTLNATLRKSIGKREGARVKVAIAVDNDELTINPDLLRCLEDEPEALNFFNNLSRSHQNYFSKWIDSARTTDTKARRIARAINALARKMHYGQMLQERI